MASTRTPTTKRLGRAARVAWVAGLLFGTIVLVYDNQSFVSAKDWIDKSVGGRQ